MKSSKQEQEKEEKNIHILNIGCTTITGGVFIGGNFGVQNTVINGSEPPRAAEYEDAEATPVYDESTDVSTDAASVAAQYTAKNASQNAVFQSQVLGDVMLPMAICEQLRENAEHARMFVSILREGIAPITGRHGSKWKWSHVRRVLQDEKIIPKDTTDTEFGRLMAKIVPELKAENVRNNCKTHPLEYLGPNGGHSYDYTSEYQECVLCMEVAQTLTPVIEYIRVR